MCLMFAQVMLCKKIDTDAKGAIMVAEWSNGRTRRSSERSSSLRMLTNFSSRVGCERQYFFDTKI
ncbi:MAG: hypothetical protein UV80_C0007G0027 [Candidatus Peregrinibacteria bacterium GW2011_GWF2_43_17]|nr:MAG: hypothetical protein UV80_C0007G0027 [Candidatus Peregrinibacteria bacterium GW2011_GWF2_43_17]